jgi:hypothetical protein
MHSYMSSYEYTPSHHVGTFVTEAYTPTFSDLAPFHSAQWNYFPKTLYSSNQALSPFLALLALQMPNFVRETMEESESLIFRSYKAEDRRRVWIDNQC